MPCDRRPSHPAATVLAAMLVGAAGCGGADAPPAPAFDPADLDAEAAFREVADLVALGPRDAGTAGAERAARHIAERFAALGLEVRVDAFEDPTPRGPVTFRNVIGTIRGGGGGRILVGSHYDTKSGISDRFVGANDSGSSTGLLLELARVAKASGYGAGPVPDLWFVAFDGEECMVRYGRHDGFHGSRRLARELREQGRVADTRAVIVLDMVGDRDLRVTIPANSTPALTRLALAAADAEGVRSAFGLHPYPIGDDHVAFLDAGIPAIDLIDFAYGPVPGANSYWHTDADTLDKISAESLGLVGRVTLRMLNELVRDPGPGA